MTAPPSEPYPPARRPWVRLELAFLLALPVLVANGLLVKYEVDVPFVDDYRTVLAFGNRFAMAHGAQKLLPIVAMQHYEYKLVWLHMVVAGELLLSHRIDFNVLNRVGMVFLLGVLGLLWTVFFRSVGTVERRLLLFLPVVLLVSNLNYAEGEDWTSACLMYQPLLFFVVSAILLLARGGCWRFGIACLCAMLACFSALNAILLWPAGLLMLCRRRAFVALAPWSAAFALGLAPYLYHYGRVVYAEPNRWGIVPEFFLVFLGGSAPMYSLALPAGVLMLAAFVWMLRNGALVWNEAATVLGMWLVATALMVAVGRNHSGLAFSHISRYKIFSSLLLAVLYGLMMERTERTVPAGSTSRAVYAASLAGSLLVFAAGAHMGLSFLRARRTLLEANTRYYWADPEHHAPLHFDDPAIERFHAGWAREAWAELDQSMRLGIYLLPGKPANEQQAHSGRLTERRFAETDAERTMSR